MKEDSPIPRLLASPLAALLAVLGLLALAAAARDVPQGIDASTVLESFGRGTGPFIVLFGLHRLGASFFLWSALGLLALHLVAIRVLQGPSESPAGSLWRWVPVILLLPLLPLSQRWAGDPDPLRDPIRLAVRSASGSQDAFKVEEGAAYRLPGAEGMLLFGSLSLGPWAGEALPDGSLRLHLPVPVAEAPATFQVSARRPPVIEPWQPSALQGVPLYGASLAASVLAALLWVLGTAQPTPGPRDRGPRIGVAAAMALVLLGPLWFAPEGPGQPLISRSSGASLLYGALVRTRLDVASWIGALPVRHPSSLATPVLQASLALLGTLALFRMARPLRKARGPDRLIQVVAVAMGLGGLVLSVLAVLRLPLPLNQDSLSSWLESRYLALVPSSWSVLETFLSTPGPWTHSWIVLTLHALVLLSLGMSLWAIASGHRTQVHWPTGPFAIALALLGLLQAVGSLWAVPAGLLPEAALPSSLLMVLLALTGWALREDASSGLHAGRLCLAAASLLQMSLVL